MNYAVFRALRMELFNPSHADPASCCFGNFPVSACPKVDADSTRSRRFRTSPALRESW